MNTPIYDFANEYAGSGTERFHMPGHKGKGPLGVEPLDITEITGSDNLYDPTGIIKASEENASLLFGSERTVYSTEGSSQCIKAMLYLTYIYGLSRTKKPLILAARNVHSSFIAGAALTGIDVEWLDPSIDFDGGICSYPVKASGVKEKVSKYGSDVIAVYLTCPDYLGGVQDIMGIAKVCHEAGVLLLVDNAHGAYFKFLNHERYPEFEHPLDLGADMCCDSAHKTLPALTGSAYLHFGKNCPENVVNRAKEAMQLFGSTSPSYLIMESLDLCNKYISDGYKEKLDDFLYRVDKLKEKLTRMGINVCKSDPLRLTIKISGSDFPKRLRNCGGEFEFADKDYMVLLLSPESGENFEYVILKACEGIKTSATSANHKFTGYSKVMTIREAVFSEAEKMPVSKALNRISSETSLHCPPAIPIVMPGEHIGAEEINLLKQYGYETIKCVKG